MKHSFLPQRGIGLWLLGAAVIVTLGIWGCGVDNTPTAPSGMDDVLGRVNPQLLHVMAVQDRHTQRLMADPEVIGTATTLDESGQPAIMLLVTSERARGAAPKSIEGVPTKVLLTDKIVAMGKPGGGGVSHTAKQTPPIQLGTSGGWRYDLANGYCCGGTLGSLVQKGGTQYVLSNYHVLEADIVAGGNNRSAQAGDPVIQPGLIDVGCNAANAQNVATLSGQKSLPGSNVDAAYAAVIPGMVRSDGAILEVGTISASTVAAFVNQAVKKSGRTTGLTRSTVTGLNATISVSYENECAGGSAFTKTYTGQILVGNRSSKFLAGGDSGSLMVEDVATNPRAVGLLFAGSTTIAVANPIDQVLSWVGGTMVGQ
ncbi:MAG TPA: hypothetical protein VNN55_12655 [bacterium]|nr:hypothetical protein [bacterium]